MTTVLKINFSDFKELANNRRVYFFKGTNYFDFIYFIEGIVVKATVLTSEIPNVPQFFSDKLFYGAKPLLIPISDPVINGLEFVEGIKQFGINIVEPIQNEETKQTDIQEKGVK